MYLEALVTYINAGPDLINQCALELGDEIRKAAAARGVRPHSAYKLGYPTP